MSKRVPLTVAQPRIVTPVEDWVTSRHGHDATSPAPVKEEAPPEPTVRLTFDVPKSMHKRLKQGALDRELAIADVLREMIAREFPAP
jgi:hypothetical protein